MNRSELIKLIVNRTGVSGDNADKVLTACEQIAEEVMAQGDELRIKGFGRFFVKHTNARKVRNPNTGKVGIAVPRCLPAFKFSTYLIDRIKKGSSNGK